MQVHSYLHGVPLGYKTDDPCGRGGNSLGIIREDVKYWNFTYSKTPKKWHFWGTPPNMTPHPPLPPQKRGPEGIGTESWGDSPKCHPPLFWGPPPPPPPPYIWRVLVVPKLHTKRVQLGTPPPGGVHEMYPSWKRVHFYCIKMVPFSLYSIIAWYCTVRSSVTSLVVGDTWSSSMIMLQWWWRRSSLLVSMKILTYVLHIFRDLMKSLKMCISLVGNGPGPLFRELHK